MSSPAHVLTGGVGSIQSYAQPILEHHRRPRLLTPDAKGARVDSANHPAVSNASHHATSTAMASLSAAMADELRRLRGHSPVAVPRVASLAAASNAQANKLNVASQSAAAIGFRVRPATATAVDLARSAARGRAATVDHRETSPNPAADRAVLIGGVPVPAALSRFIDVERAHHQQAERQSPLWMDRTARERASDESSSPHDRDDFAADVPPRSRRILLHPESKGLRRTHYDTTTSADETGGQSASIPAASPPRPVTYMLRRTLELLGRDVDGERQTRLSLERAFVEREEEHERSQCEAMQRHDVSLLAMALELAFRESEAWVSFYRFSDRLGETSHSRDDLEKAADKLQLALNHANSELSILGELKREIALQDGDRDALAEAARKQIAAEKKELHDQSGLLEAELTRLQTQAKEKLIAMNFNGASSSAASSEKLPRAAGLGQGPSASQLVSILTRDLSEVIARSNAALTASSQLIASAALMDRTP